MPTTEPTRIQKAGAAIKSGAQRAGNYTRQYIEGERDINWKRVGAVGLVGLGLFFGGRYAYKKYQQNKTYKGALDDPASQLAQRAKEAMGSKWVWDGTDETALHDVFRDAKSMGLKMEDVDKAFYKLYNIRLAKFVEEEGGADLYTSLTQIYKLGAEKDKQGNTILSTKAKVQVAPGDWLICNSSTGAFARKTPVKTSSTWNYIEGATNTFVNNALWPISLIKGVFTGDYKVVKFKFSNIVGVIQNGDLAGRFTGRYALDTTSGSTVLFYEVEPYEVSFFSYIAIKNATTKDKIKRIAAMKSSTAAKAMGFQFQKPIWVAASSLKPYYNQAEKNPTVKSLIAKYPELDAINGKANGKLDNFPLCYSLLINPSSFIYSYNTDSLAAAENSTGSTKIYTIGEKLNGLGKLGTTVKTKYDTTIYDKNLRVVVKRNTVLGTKIAEIKSGKDGKRTVIQFRSPMGDIWYVKSEVVNII